MATIYETSDGVQHKGDGNEGGYWGSKETAERHQAELDKKSSSSSSRPLLDHSVVTPLIDARKFFDDALVFYERDDIKSSFYYFDKAMNYFQEIYFNYIFNPAMENVALTQEFKKYIVDRDFLKLIHSHVMYGKISYWCGVVEQKDKALFYLNKAIELSERVKVKPSIIAEAYYQRAQIKDNGGEDTFNMDSFDDYLDAIKYGLDTLDKEEAILALTYCGMKHIQTDKKKAKEYLMLAVDFDPDSNAAKTCLGILANEGITNYKPKKYKAPIKQEKTRSDYFTGAEEEFKILYKGNW